MEQDSEFGAYAFVEKEGGQVCVYYGMMYGNGIAMEFGVGIPIPYCRFWSAGAI